MGECLNQLKSDEFYTIFLDVSRVEEDNSEHIQQLDLHDIVLIDNAVIENAQ